MAAKRFLNESGSDPDEQSEKRKRTRPSLASVIGEAVMVNSLQNFCSTLEPLLRRVVSEEVEQGLRRCSRSFTRDRALVGSHQPWVPVRRACHQQQHLHANFVDCSLINSTLCRRRCSHGVGSRIIGEVVMVNSLNNFCSALEPLLRKVLKKRKKKPDPYCYRFCLELDFDVFSEKDWFDCLRTKLEYLPRMRNFVIVGSYGCGGSI
ncbi:hypothetical protein L1049_028084 [Liquidambar formosana]|uniref:Uncharacterized protein n=1 Tax=Liquidambar formosana TaxID=63359 RepID=A0AAP0RIE3_LIQFO